MSYSGRSWPKLGKKMLTLAPLAKQRVAPDDSVLGALANSTGPGLLPQYSYQSLIQSAFQPAYWNSDQLVDASGNLLRPNSISLCFGDSPSKPMKQSWYRTTRATISLPTVTRKH
jgi:hypothetical protein